MICGQSSSTNHYSSSQARGGETASSTSYPKTSGKTKAKALYGIFAERTYIYMSICMCIQIRIFKMLMDDHRLTEATPEKGHENNEVIGTSFI